MRYRKSYCGCDPEHGLSPRLKVKPPVFASPVDAWNHFVRHPDDFPLIDEDDEVNTNLELFFQGQMDIFDCIDSYTHQSFKESQKASSKLEASTVTEDEGNETDVEDVERNEV